MAGQYTYVRYTYITLQKPLIHTYKKSQLIHVKLFTFIKNFTRFNRNDLLKQNIIYNYVRTYVCM